MRTSALSAAAILAGSAAAADSCVKGLHIIVGRGTTEPPGTGVTGVLANKIAEEIGDSDVVPVDYPATLSDPAYGDSVMAGVEALTKEVTEYAEQCPGGKMAYLGYSQGGQIAANAFCGGQGSIFGDNEPIPSEAVENVVAIALFGNPSHNLDFSFSKGTSDHDGIFVRDEEGACSNFADKIVSYCDDGDVYCDAGQNDTVHGLYLERYSQEVQDFVVSQYNAALDGDDGDGSSTTSAAPTHSATGSSMTAAPTGGNATMTTSHMPPTPTDGGGDDEKPTTPPATGAAAGLTANNLVVALPMAMIAAVQML